MLYSYVKMSPWGEAGYWIQETSLVLLATSQEFIIISKQKVKTKSQEAFSYNLKSWFWNLHRNSEGPRIGQFWKERYSWRTHYPIWRLSIKLQKDSEVRVKVQPYSSTEQHRVQNISILIRAWVTQLYIWVCQNSPNWNTQDLCISR